MSEEAHLTPAHHLQELLARARNPFDIADTVLDRLRTAVMFQAELVGWRHRNTPPPRLRCSSFRHVFLLADGSSLLLWELCYDSPDGLDELHEIYDNAEALRVSERRVHREADEVHGVDADAGDADPDGGAGCPTGFGDLLSAADPVGEPRPRREDFVRDGSAEHARRLLRRAENPDRPGAETLRLLSGSLGHHITHIPKPRTRPGEEHVWCAVYEHAFLLPDGVVVSLYELEHNMSGNGRLVCEVYLEESVADRAAHRLGRERGLDL